MFQLSRKRRNTLYVVHRWGNNSLAGWQRMQALLCDRYQPEILQLCSGRGRQKASKITRIEPFSLALLRSKHGFLFL